MVGPPTGGGSRPVTPGTKTGAKGESAGAG